MQIYRRSPLVRNLPRGQCSVVGKYGQKKPKTEHSFSSTQVNLSGPAKDAVLAMAKAIPSKELAEDGREDVPHVTVKFGLHFRSPSVRLRRVIEEFGVITATLGKTSLFQNDDADVLKVDVDSADLHRLNALVSKVIPTHTTHPTYIPHVTIAYLKPGLGKKYAGRDDLAGRKLQFDRVLFSDKDGHMEEIKLGSKRAYRAVA